jgi:rhamnosyltransferase
LEPIVKDKIIAVVVTFQPDLVALNLLFQQLASQVAGIALVDNGSRNVSELRLLVDRGLAGAPKEFVFAQYLDTNIGLAAAQNIAIERCQVIKATHVILFDQDSEPTDGMVAELRLAEVRLVMQDVQLAAVGPCYVDTRQNNPPPFISVRGLRLIRHQCVGVHEPVEVDYLIASGLLIRASVLRQVGYMRADFFIDYVDIEWGLRARRSGFRTFGVCTAKMNHSLGDTPIKWMGKNIPLHSPLRHYFHFRNAVRLYFDASIPWNWKLVDGSRLVLKFGFYCLFASPRWGHCLSMLAGIRDGVLQKGGPR